MFDWKVIYFIHTSMVGWSVLTSMLRGSQAGHGQLVSILFHRRMWQHQSTIKAGLSPSAPTQNLEERTPSRVRKLTSAAKTGRVA